MLITTNGLVSQGGSTSLFISLIIFPVTFFVAFLIIFRVFFPIIFLGHNLSQSHSHFFFVPILFINLVIFLVIFLVTIGVNILLAAFSYLLSVSPSLSLSFSSLRHNGSLVDLWALEVDCYLCPHIALGFLAASGGRILGTF